MYTFSNKWYPQVQELELTYNSLFQCEDGAINIHSDRLVLVQQ